MIMSGQIDTYRRRDIGTSYPLNWSIKVVKGFALDDLCADFGTNTEGRETTLDDEETV
jgi:hypothetical protein